MTTPTPDPEQQRVSGGPLHRDSMRSQPLVPHQVSSSTPDLTVVSLEADGPVWLDPGVSPVGVVTVYKHTKTKVIYNVLRVFGGV